MKEIKAFVRPSRLEAVLGPLHNHPEFPGIAVSNILGFGHVVGRSISGEESGMATVSMVKVECVVPDDLYEKVVEIILDGAQTGHPGDGKIIVRDVGDVIRISSGERLTG